MSGSDKVDIMATAPLERKHHVCEVLMSDPIAVTPVIDFPILAKAAQQVAVGKENRARSAGSDQGTLFAKVRAERRNFKAIA